MSSPPRTGPRSELEAALLGALHDFADQEAIFDQALADQLGLHPTDVRVLGLLERTGAMTAGRIADASGLTSGAVTALVDRLERAKQVRRDKDPRDRRQVLVGLAPDRARTHAEALAAFGQRLAKAWSEREDRKLADAAELVRAASESLAAETAARRAAAAPGFEGEAIAVPIGRLHRAILRLANGSSRARLRSDAALADLVQVRHQGRAPEVKADGGLVTVQYPRFSLFDWRKLALEVTLRGGMPWSFEIRGGTYQLDADLRGITLESLEIIGGASEVTILLPEPHGVVPVKVTGGADQVSIRRPRGVAARFEVRGGASKLAFDEQVLGAVGGTVSLVSPDARDSSDRYEVSIVGGANKVALQFMDD